MMHVGLAIMAKLEQHKAKLEVMIALRCWWRWLTLPYQARIMKQSACIDDMRLEEASTSIRPAAACDVTFASYITINSFRAGRSPHPRQIAARPAAAHVSGVFLPLCFCDILDMYFERLPSADQLAK